MYTQDVTGCFETKGLVPSFTISQWEKEQQVIAPLLPRLRDTQHPASAILNALDHPLEAIVDVVEMLRSFKAVIILGTGGSTLCGQTLVGLNQFQRHVTQKKDNPRLCFLDNIDPSRVDHELATLPLTETAILAISKSGKTLETLSQLLCCIERLEPHCSGSIGKNLVIISDPGDNPIRVIASRYGAHVLDHVPEIGGRFSIFTNVGLIPALLSGCDIRALIKGAAAFRDQECKGSTRYSSDAAAMHSCLMRSGISIHVMMTYISCLSEFCSWYRQIWAESLGKKGHGTLPVRSIGTIDQHSQLQLYLDGPADKMFTVVTRNTAAGGHAFSGNYDEFGLGYLKGKAMGDIFRAEYLATIETLHAKGRPLRRIHFESFSEEGAGAFLLQCILETILMAEVLGINAFDQPAVEDGKIRAKRHLMMDGQKEIVR